MYSASHIVLEPLNLFYKAGTYLSYAVFGILTFPFATTQNHRSPVAMNQSPEWSLSKEMLADDGQSLHVFTQTEPGKIIFRTVVVANVRVAEFFCLGREADLAPIWATFVESAAICALGKSPFEFTEYAVVSVGRPLPSFAVVGHVTVEDRMSVDGTLLTKVRQPPEDFDDSGLPPLVQERLKSAVNTADIVFTPVYETDGHAARCTVESTLAVNISGFDFLGPLKHMHPPQWLINLFVMATSSRQVFNNVLRVVNEVHRGERYQGSHGQRYADDATGLYAAIRKAAKQP